MKTATDKIIHSINGKYYLEYVDGHIEKIALASAPSTEDMLQRLIKQDPNALTCN